MSAKLLHALTDENPDLKKQIGCMTGIFQIFDRHHILTPRRITGQAQKRLPTGNSRFNNGNLGVEPDGVRYVQTASERNHSKNSSENHRVSMESSGASVSSSCSSSFSSLDYKTSQQESNSSERIIFPETPTRDPPNHSNASQLGRHSLDFRDVVKDSIYREAHGLSVKTTMKQEPVSPVMKHRDSPRHLQLSKSVNGSFGVGSNSKQRVPVDLNDSERAPAKLREAPWNCNGGGERPRSSYEGRDRSSFSLPKDSPRFSYDGRETHNSSFDSRDTLKSTTKLRELPRLSLDSRESYMKNSNSDPKSNLISKDLLRSISYNLDRTSNLQQEVESYKHSTSVVAKLMGLEGLPKSTPNTEYQMRFIKTCSSEVCDPSLKSLKTNTGSKESRNSSPKSSIRDSVSPRLRSPDSIMRPVSPRLPIEPAPWKKLDGGRGSPKAVPRNQEFITKASNPPPSVYAEIEKRLKELEFRQSDRDLRALKQILDTMQAKGLLEAKKEDKSSNFVSQTNKNNLNQHDVDPDPRLANRRNPHSNRLISATAKGATPKSFESPIVIMKPAKLIQKSGIPASSVIPIDRLSGLRLPKNSNSANNKKDSANNRTPRFNHRETANRALSSTDRKDNGRTMKASQTSTNPQQLSTANPESTVRNSGSVSPRLQQKKLELEKRCRPPIPSRDSSNPRKQSTRQPTESGSPGGRARGRSYNSRHSDDQLRELSRDSRNLSQGDEFSQQSDNNNNSFNSHMDIEVTSADRSAEVLFQQGSQSPCRKAAKNTVSNLKQKKPSPRLSGDGLLTELATVVPEQPSPVSVLDSSFYKDELSSPVKKISPSLNDVEIQNCNGHLSEDDHHQMMTGAYLSSGINRTKLENIEHLVKKLRRLNSNHNESTTDYIASLCENINPDHRYISEILLASGLLLRDLGSGITRIQLHPSGHPINPDLFFVLEQTKASNGVSKDGVNYQKVGQLKSDQDKRHRKLVFDAVNEVLVQKLCLVGLSNEPWIQTDKLTGTTMNAQRLLKELCSEIEQLQANKKADCSFDEDEDTLKPILTDDVMRCSENWVDFHKEVPVVALDIERLIFKDLIDEIVSGEAANQ